MRFVVNDESNKAFSFFLIFSFYSLFLEDGRHSYQEGHETDGKTINHQMFIICLVQDFRAFGLSSRGQVLPQPHPFST